MADHLGISNVVIVDVRVMDNGSELVIKEPSSNSSRFSDHLRTNTPGKVMNPTILSPSY